MTNDELDAFYKHQGIKAYLLTSVESVEGVKELILKIYCVIHLTAKPATFTIGAFK